jgi:hypothetical protein
MLLQGQVFSWDAEVWRGDILGIVLSSVPAVDINILRYRDVLALGGYTIHENLESTVTR